LRHAALRRPAVWSNGPCACTGVRSREQPRSNIASMAQTTITCHLINVALEAGESIQFSKEKMDIVGKTGKNSIYYSREYRKPWKLPIYK